MIDITAPKSTKEDIQETNEYHYTSAYPFIQKQKTTLRKRQTLELIIITALILVAIIVCIISYSYAIWLVAGIMLYVLTVTFKGNADWHSIKNAENIIFDINNLYRIYNEISKIDPQNAELCIEDDRIIIQR